MRYLSVDSGLDSRLGKAGCGDQSVNSPLTDSTETGLEGRVEERGT